MAREAKASKQEEEIAIETLRQDIKRHKAKNNLLAQAIVKY